MKRGRLLVFFLLLVLAAASVHAEVIFDEWVQDGKPFEVLGEELRASFRQQNQKGTIFTPSITFLVDLGQCEQKDVMKYCIEDVDYDNAVYKDGREYPMIKVRIETPEPTIGITQTLSTVKPRQLERVEALITILNSGELRAENLRLEILLPRSVRVVSTSGGSIVGSSIVFETYLLPGQEKTYKYIFEPRELLDFTIEPKASYRFFGKTRTVYGKTDNIKVKLPFDFEESLSDDALKRGETLEYNITFANTARRGDVEIEPLTVIVSPGLSVIEFRGFTKEARMYTYSDKLRKGEEGLLTMTLRAEELGEHDIIMDVLITAEGQTIKKRTVHTIMVSASDITPYLAIDLESVRSDSDFTIKADLKNRQSKTIRNVIATISFDPPLLDSMRYPGIFLRSRQRASVVKKEITAPQVDVPTDLVVTLSGRYSDSGIIYEFEASELIRIEPFIRPVSVSHRFNETPRKGGNVSIILTVKNLRSVLLPSVSILDSIDGIKVIDGKSYADFSMAGEEEKEFSYAIHIPEDHGDSISIETILNAEVDSEFIKIKMTEDLSLNLDAPIGEGVPMQLDEPGEIGEQGDWQEGDSAEGPEDQEGKKGFFARIIAWFANLF